MSNNVLEFFDYLYSFFLTTKIQESLNTNQAFLNVFLNVFDIQLFSYLCPIFIIYIKHLFMSNKIKKVYHIKLKVVLTEEQEREIEENVFQLFKNILTDDEFKSIAFHQNKKDKSESLYLFIKDLKAENIINHLNNLSIIDKYEDISMKILMDEIDTTDETFKETFCKNGEFDHLLKNYISMNLTSDIVLDKISKNGTSSLKEVDYTILESI